MKICLSISTLSSGGAERNACLLANLLSKTHNVSIITFQDKKKKSFYNLSSDIEVKNLDLLKNNKNKFFKFINFIKRIYVINRYLKKKKPEVIISFLETMNITILLSSFFIKGINVKIISDRNNPLKSEKPLLILILKIIFYRFSNYLVLQTQGIKKNYNFFDKSKIKIIKNLISDNIKTSKKKKLNKKIKIISVGRLEEQKGYDILIKSLSLLKKKNINFRCDIYGVGSKKNEIINMVQSNDLSKNVFLRGVTSNILNLYHKYDIYVLSSRYEGYPNTLLEALSAKILCITSDCDYGPKDIINNNYNGLIFKNNDEKNLFDKLFEVINNKNKYYSIVKNLKKNYSEHYNIDKLKKWNKLIKKK
jgi:glycosyltransferase involved in cell wall biosynthesis